MKQASGILTNIKLGWKDLPGAGTPNSLITALQSCIKLDLVGVDALRPPLGDVLVEQDLDVDVIKLFSFVTDEEAQLARGFDIGNPFQLGLRI